MLTLSSSSIAQRGWVSSVIIKDSATGLEVSASEPLVAGSTYNVTLTIVVPYTANIMLSAATDFERAGPQYWYVLEDSANMINYSVWNPSESELLFSAKTGALVVTLIGRVPSDACVVSYPQMELHFKRELTVVKLAIVGGSTVDSITHQVVDSAILNFDKALSARKNVLESAKGVAIEEYLSLSGGVVQLAESLAKQGYVDLASSLLNLIPGSAKEIPLKPSKSAIDLALPFVALALAAGVVGAVVLWKRTSSQLDYVKSITREQVRNLEALLVRATRVDKTLASELESLKRRLEEAG